ncbi:MAG: hypothetical protein K940chlam9_00490 [Chlamydiae bacterium]|nr:hypothetical protein [Chlamydiota bacterium]
MGNFFSRLSYSFGNEDWTTEQKALQIQPDDRVLCVTASGDRPLNLLTNELKEIVAVDANPFQTALFDLKKTALETLSFKDYLSFLGASGQENRLYTYQNIAPSLSDKSLALWNKHKRKISRGVLYEGSVEKILYYTSHILHACRGKKIRTLFSFDQLEEQKTYVQEHWDSYLWRKAFDIAMHPMISRSFFKDPCLYENVDPNIHIGKYLCNHLKEALYRFPAKESILLSLLFNGKVSPSHFPPYLQEKGVEKIKKQLHKATFQTAGMLSYLQSCEDNSIDCFSLSDIASYMEDEEFEKITYEVYRTARPGARFCIRQFLSNQKRISLPAFKRDQALEKQLEQEDRCFVYRFMTGTIEKNSPTPV